MKVTPIFCIILTTNLLFSSCMKDKNGTTIETITKGSKWGIQIGSTAAEVYQALQQLNNEKDGKVEYVAYRQQHTFTKPDEIEHRYLYYNAITLQSSEAVIYRAIISYDAREVKSIEVGGALPEGVDKMPQDAPDEIAIHPGDPVETLYAKISAIFELPGYHNYQIILPDKTLLKDFDPALAEMTQWYFGFEESLSPRKTGMSNVTLYFTKGKLAKMVITYREGEIII